MAGRHRKTRTRHRGRHRRRRPVAQVALPAGVAVAVVTGAAVGLSQLVGGGTGTRLPAARAAGALPAASAPATGPSPGPGASVLGFHTARPAHRPGAAHHVRRSHRRDPTPRAVLRVVDIGSPCYVEVRRGGQLLAQRIIRGRQHLTFRRHGLDVVLGNAGGVRIAVGSGHLHRAGASGEVRRFHVR